MQESLKIKMLKLGEDGFHLMCKVKISGKKVRALIDTGASKSVISASLSLLLPHLESVNVLDSQATGISPGQLDANFVMLDKVKFGPVKIENLAVAVMDMTHIMTTYKEAGLDSFDMIIGGDILKSTKAAIDYRNKKIWF
jgi:predicted aspartyl protease